MEIQKIKINLLNPAPYNPRLISDTEMAKLKKSILEFGFLEPVVVNKDMVIIGGHQRVKAAQQLGWEEVDCYMVDLSPERAKLLNLALNRIQGEWDYNKLYDVLLSLPDDDLKLAGFDKHEIDKIKDLLNTLDDGGSLEDEFEKEIKQVEFRILITPDHPDLEKVRYQVRKIKEEFPNVIIKESL